MKYFELISVSISAIALSIICVRIEAFELIAAFVSKYDAWQLDEAIVVLLWAGLAAGILLVGRSSDLRREVLRRQAAEEATAEMSRQALSRNMAERRLLKEAVRSKEQRLESILATAHQAIVTIDRDGRVTGWNRHAELTFGWNAQEVIGQRVSQIIVPPEMRAAHEKGLARFMESRTARLIGSRIEVTALRRNGDIFPIELALSATNIGDEWQFTALIQDISERRAQTELFENAFDHAPIGIALVALDGQLLKLNSAFCDIIGYPVDEARTLDFQGITHADDLAADLELLGKLVAGAIPSYQLEKRYIRKSGRIVWVRLSVSMVLGNDGAPRHLIAQIQDLSAQRESEARYRLLAQNASDMVGIYSMEGRCFYMSPSSEKILGYLPEELVGRSVFGFVPLEDREAMAAAHEPLQAAPAGSTVTHQTRLRHKQGHLVHIEFVAGIVMSDDGEPRFVSACRDVTVRMEAQTALEERTRELTHAYHAAERSAAQVREAEAFFKGIFDSSPDLNFVCDVSDGAIVMNIMNAAAEAALETTTAQARGKDLDAIFPPQVPTSMLREDLEAVIATGEGGQRTTARGDTILDVRMVPLCGDFGKVRRIFVSKRDITELKRAERAALQANALMQTAEKIAHMGYSALDLITQKMTWSDEIWTIFALDRERDTPSFDKLINRRHPEDREQAAKVLADAIAGGATEYENSYRLLLPCGTIRHILARGTIQREDGVAVSAFGVLLDISELKQAEEKARESDLRYRLMAENSTDVIVTSDLAGHTTFVSPSSQLVTGYTSEDRMGFQPDNITHPDDIDGLHQTFRSLWKGGSAKCVRWRVWHKTDKRWVWVESSPALLRDPVSQVPTGYLDVIRDVTAQKAQEDALAAAQRAAEEAMHSKERFLANMSHELRTPLNSIIGFSRLLNESSGLEAEDQRRVGLVHNAGLALYEVIDNVLDFSKLEADKLALRCAPFDVAPFFTGTVSLLEPQAAARDVLLSVHVDPAVPDRLIGDDGRLRQILLNLLSNAVKFTQHGSVTTKVLVVDCATDAARLRVEVVDTGDGIAPDKIGNLFNRFAQANESIARHYGGTGLGLAISRQLVALMGGEIGVSSTVGEGSTFWFEISLPLTDASEDDADDKPAVAPLSLVGKRILVVDDVDLNRELMLAMLSRYGCTTVLAEDGMAALAAVEMQPFDLILMDCQMPVMDGFAATQALRKQTGAAATMPIVALTASAQPEHLARCRDAGMDEHLSKPLDPRVLEEVLVRYLVDVRPPATGEHPPQSDPAATQIASPRPATRFQPSASAQAKYARHRASTLEEVDALIRRGNYADEEVHAAADLLHKLAGTAGMFGQTALGDRASELENGLLAWPKDERAERIAFTAALLREAA